MVYPHSSLLDRPGHTAEWQVTAAEAHNTHDALLLANPLPALQASHPVQLGASWEGSDSDV